MSPGDVRGKHALRVLVVDDYEDAAETMALLLRLYGYEVQVAQDGLSALQTIQNWWPDAVLLDLALPGMDGYQVAQRIRADTNGKNKPLLIALTGYGREEDRLRSLTEGIDQHFVKPTDPALLLRWLQDQRPNS